MDFNALFSEKRTGKDKNYPDPIRSEYQRDFDRLIFSSAFRRLQNKTQVFPLPGSSFVHNRLTHSLEVSTVGRSLGKLAGVFISKKYAAEQAKEFYKYELDNVIAAACLAHDIGNPAFGHSGESAISNYFIDNESKYRDLFNDGQWGDLANFEGNANAFRILTHQFKGNLPGGQRLTYTTLAAIIKYPCESTGADGSKKHFKKYNCFQAEKEQFVQVANTFNLKKESDEPLRYCRHPFAYLLEAADDITYNIIDFEDAHRLGILSLQEIEEKFYQLIKCIGRTEDNFPEIDRKLSSLSNDNEKVSYLRSRAINSLILQTEDIFEHHCDEILNGTFNDSLMGVLEKTCSAFKDIKDISYDRIYNHRTVVELELAGYNVMYELLKLMIPAVLAAEGDRDKKDRKAILLAPAQYGPFGDAATPYQKCLGILDFVSGMTDNYATELYRKIKGIEIGKHN